MRLTRLLRSEDTQQDRLLVDNGGQVRVIIAYGETDAFSYHLNNRRGLKLSLFGDAEAEGEDTLSDLKADDFMYQVHLGTLFCGSISPKERTVQHDVCSTTCATAKQLTQHVALNHPFQDHPLHFIRRNELRFISSDEM